ncbi:protein phosphatase Slingshot homolog 1 isoform X2 [Meleagris gallopavo]|uniref:Protein phosphatase Slingshot homolog 1 n=2 Tax=Meleagris gallopavo TaxID=9103 RepID=G1N2H9_MELGA|nr:protein phosphatase Slingshot homolog 1 isoform X2 [Meleagris gallopavo]XP_031411837.1 protein phosphatase Slingshot homolog 1 isoform X2 [Meleagris gallopavo]
MVKGAALFLQQGNSSQGQRSLQHPHKHAGDLPQHLQVMINLLRCEDRIKLAVRLESVWTDRVRYMVVVYSNGRQDTEENILLGVDFSSKESKSCTIGMVLRLWSDTKIHLDGDGGFSVSTAGRMHIFKPVSVQAMWSALQILHKACEVARRYNYFPGGMALVWATYYESCISSDQSCINEWNAMQDLESTRPDSPALFVDKPTERERTERLIKAKLRSIMMSKDLENVTSKEIRNELEKHMNCNLKEFKEFIDNEMLLILGQMDKPSLIFDHLYLGSEWNASNLEELQGSGIDYILNVTREIDNFFPGLFAYHNIRVYDEETTDLLAHWNEAYHFINKAKKNHSKCLVHCKMGVSRSASTVIAYAMKEFGWSLEKAYNYVKQKRSIARPNAGFMRQLLEYEGILDASKQRHNKLWKQQAESNLPQSTDGTAGSGDFLLESLDIDLENRLADLDTPSQSAYLDNRAGTELPIGFNYCFRRLSDTLLENKVPGDRGSFCHVEQLERDALTERAASLARQPPTVPPEMAKGLEPAEPLAELSSFCDKEVKKKRDFSPRKARMVLGAVEPGEDGIREENPVEKWKRRLSMHKEESRLNRENLNNNNSKRSCPEDFEHDAVFGILSKVKPSYQSCADCMYSSGSLAPDSFGEQCEKLNSSSAHRSSTICTQPALLSHLPPLGEHLLSRARMEEGIGTRNTEALLPLSAGGGALEAGACKSMVAHQCGFSEKGKDAPEIPVRTLQPRRNSHCDKSLLSTEVVKEESLTRKDSKPTKDLKYLLFSKDLEKPSANSYLMQHQESLIQLQKAGLVRKHTKELERLRSLPSDTSLLLRESALGRAEPSIAEEGEELVPHPGLVPLLRPSPPVPGDAESDLEKLEVKRVLEGGTSQKTSTPMVCRLEHTSSFTKDFLKTICYTPSSSRSSNLTRSSSSDSIHSVRGKPGLVKQRTQEIETRLRLAGLTVSSPLKRSNSLAKLGCLNLSSEDLSSDMDVSTITGSKEAVSSESSGLCEPPSAPRGADVGSKMSAKPALGNMKTPLWLGKS